MQLAKIDEEVVALQEEFERCTRDAEVLRVDMEATEEVLSKAQMLLDKLSGEKTRWSGQSAQPPSRL